MNEKQPDRATSEATADVEPIVAESSQAPQPAAEKDDAAPIPAEAVRDEPDLTPDPLPEPSAEPIPVPEPTAEITPEPVTKPAAEAPPSKTRESRKASSFGSAVFGALFGVALTAGGGAAAWHFDVFNLRQHFDLTATNQRLSTLEGTVREGAAQTAAISNPEFEALISKTQALEAALADALQKIDETRAQPAAADPKLNLLAQDIETLSQKLNALQMPQADHTAQTEAMIQAAFARWQVEAAAATAAQAEAIKAQSIAEAAYQTLGQALQAGTPYSEALAALHRNDIPAILTTYAHDGLPSQAQLREQFPDYARAALQAALKDKTNGEDTIWAFFRLQTGARSLSPQQGTGPDAILSRAEAAAAANDFALALTELAALPAAAQTIMQPWIETAKARLEAQAAYDQMSLPAKP